MVYSNFCRITHRFWEIWCDLEISPRSSTVASRESCRVAMYVKCSEDSERMKRKSPCSATTLIWRNDAPCPGNPREYLHKPYTARNYVPCATFLSLTVWVALQIFEQFCPKTGDANPSIAKPETDFNAKSPFKVFQGHLFWYHWRAIIKGLYIAQYNKCDLNNKYEGSEDIASERSENRHFRPPHSHLTLPLQRTPANIRIKFTLLETKIPGLHFCRWYYGSIFIQILVVGSETRV